MIIFLKNQKYEIIEKMTKESFESKEISKLELSALMYGVFYPVIACAVAGGIGKKELGMICEQIIKTSYPKDSQE